MDYCESPLPRSLIHRVLCAFLVVGGILWPRSWATAAIQLGPEVAISLPQAVQLGVEGYCTEGSVLCTERLRGYFDIGGLEFPLASSDRALSVFNLESGIRYFSESMPFFAGIALGLRYIGFKASLSSFQVDGAALATSATLNFTTFYLGPLLGVHVSLGEGFLLEANAGLEFSLYSNGNMYLVNADTGATSNNSDLLQVDSKTAMSRIAGLTLPTLTVVRLVRYF